MALPLHPVLIGHVLRNLRACDQAEVWPVVPRGATPEIVAEMLASASVGRVFCEPGTDLPAAAIGGVEQHPGCWSVWMFATDGWARVWRSLVRYARHELTPDLIARGCHRAETCSIVGHPDAGKLLRHLGFIREGYRLQLGSARQDYEAWAYLVPAGERV